MPCPKIARAYRPCAARMRSRVVHADRAAASVSAGAWLLLLAFVALPAHRPPRFAVGGFSTNAPRNPSKTLCSFPRHSASFTAPAGQKTKPSVILAAWRGSVQKKSGWSTSPFFCTGAFHAALWWVLFRRLNLCESMGRKMPPSSRHVGDVLASCVR